MAAHLAPDRIPMLLFDTLVDGHPQRRKALTDALNALHELSLVEISDGMVDIHRLLQKVIREDASASGETWSYDAALTAISQAFPDDTALPASWPQCEPLVPHIVALASAKPRPENRPVPPPARNSIAHAATCCAATQDSEP